MLRDTPLRDLHERYVREAFALTPSDAAITHDAATTLPVLEMLPYGPSTSDDGVSCELVANFGPVELEYAAIRRSAGMMDCPHRGTVHITGSSADRRDFLNRMVTQELKDLSPGMTREAFWLGRNGRILADLFLVECSDHMLIDVDVHAASSVVTSLNEYLFAEDCQINDASSHWHRIAVHGRQAIPAIAAALGESGWTIEPGCGSSVVIHGVNVVIARRDLVGEPGCELFVPRESAITVWNALKEACQTQPSGIAIRPIGWHAFNIARIEAGTPLFNIDFGVTNLPHETGVLDRRVSFTKGCYLGQEIVARMQNLGRPKQMLVGMKIERDLLPVAGGQVFVIQSDGAMGEPIGVVTSSTLSPMLGTAPIAFAMIKTAHATTGSRVLVNAEGEQSPALVAPLRFWPAVETRA